MAEVDDSHEATLLCDAACRGRAADVRALLSAGACVDGRNAEVKLMASCHPVLAKVQGGPFTPCKWGSALLSAAKHSMFRLAWVLAWYDYYLESRV